MAGSIQAGAVEGRIARVREMMGERGYDAVVVRDEANLRWLTGADGVFDYTYEFPHAAFVTADALFLHTDSRYYNTFVEHLGPDTPWQLDQEVIAIPRWTIERARDCRARTVAVEDSMQLSFFSGMQRAAEDLSLAIAFPQMHNDIVRMRAVKDAEEIALMREAQKITDAAFEHICGFIRPGLTEKEVKTELESFMQSHGSDGFAFSTIVASGPNTANNHAIPSDRVICRGDFVLMDYGAAYHDYRSDMTRTVVVGEPSDEQRRIYECVRRAHEEAAAAIRPGVSSIDVHNVAERVLEECGFAGRMGHSLGHGVGIDIHEQPYMGARRGEEFKPGHVVTVEPGVYLPGIGGLRLEDYGVVTEDGFEPFTASTHELVVIDC